MQPLMTNDEASRIGQGFAWVYAALIFPFALAALIVVAVLMPLTVGWILVLRGIGRLITTWPFAGGEAPPPGPPASQGGAT